MEQRDRLLTKLYSLSPHTHIHIVSWNKFYWCSYLVFLHVIWKILMNSIISFHSYTVCVDIYIFLYILSQGSSPPSPLFSFTLHKILFWKKYISIKHNKIFLLMTSKAQFSSTFSRKQMHVLRSVHKTCCNIFIVWKALKKALFF